jgi:phosphate:Na+ symporter
VSNTLFNIFNAGLGVLGARILIPFLAQTSDDVVHQTANAHTAIMVLAAIVVVPLIKPSVALLRRLMPSREPEPPGSYLDADLLATPEDAIRGTLQELGRCAQLCVESFQIVAEALQSGNLTNLRRVERNEQSVDEIKASVQAYLGKLARGYLSRRQALLVQALNRCMVELERIGDHVDSLGQFVRRGRAGGLRALDPTMSAEVWKLEGLARAVVDQLAQSLASDGFDFATASWPVLEARSRYHRESAPVKAAMIEQLSRHEMAADLALKFSEFTTTLDRIVRHCAVVAMEQRQPAFVLKESKLGRAAGPRRTSKVSAE